MELALEFALNRPTGEDDSYQGFALAGFFRSKPSESPSGNERLAVIDGRRGWWRWQKCDLKTRLRA